MYILSGLWKITEIMTLQSRHPVSSAEIDKLVHISPREYNKWQRTSVPAQKKSVEEAAHSSSSEEEDAKFGEY